MIKREIERIELKKDESYEFFLKNNEERFWDLIINAIELLSKDKELNVLTAFIVFGGKLKKDREIIVHRNGIDEIFKTALTKMELREEYEMCERLIKLQKKFD
tara:strand:- start:426 stop:734 length:309 start_codon:yes stop_codon:yes gene_type:complete